MDVFFEQIVRKNPNTLQKVLKIGFVVVGVLLILYLVYLAFIFLLMGSVFSGVILLAAFGVGYGIRWYTKRMYMEYEYSITNGDFDIDRIIGKAKRERMISTSCKEFEEFGVYNDNVKKRLENRTFDAKVLAANLDKSELYYAIANHDGVGSVLLVIEPDERIKTALKKFISRTVQNDVFSRD